MNEIVKNITKCKKCQRLVNFREKIALEKRKQFINQNYWGKPVAGFGDKNAEIMLLGLAPAAHGGNRTGRLFTGDKSAEFLFKCLYEAKLANQSFSLYKNDGLKLKNMFITAALKCVPPFDKPTSEELNKCFKYLELEIKSLKKMKTIVTLGRIAFLSTLKFFGLKPKDFKFVHGATYLIKDKINLVACYHPSPRNVNTKRINKEGMIELLQNVKKLNAK